jgi:hypothetical protein
MVGLAQLIMDETFRDLMIKMEVRRRTLLTEKLAVYWRQRAKPKCRHLHLCVGRVEHLLREGHRHCPLRTSMRAASAHSAAMGVRASVDRQEKPEMPGARSISPVWLTVQRAVRGVNDR